MIYSNGGTIGRSFAPTASNVQQLAESGGDATGPGQAVQTLSLRYPRVVGAGSIAPSQLLNAPGSAGLPQQNANNPLIEAILRAVMGGFGTPQQTAPSALGGQSFPNVPSPRVTPGVDEGSQAPLVSRPPYVPPVQTRGGTEPGDVRPVPPGKRQGPDNYPERF